MVGLSFIDFLHVTACGELVDAAVFVVVVAGQDEIVGMVIKVTVDSLLIALIFYFSGS